MKSFGFLSALCAAALMQSCLVCSAAENYSGKIRIENAQIVHGQTNVSVPVTIDENSGISGIMAKFSLGDKLSLSAVDTSQSTVKGDIGIFDHINVESNALIWSTQSTENTVQTGNFINLDVNISENAYPGVYDISFASIGSRTMATNSDIESLNIDWVNGSVTINGNADDIAAASLIGDLDNDGEITSYDALLVLQTVTELNNMDIYGKITADSDFDGAVTSYDALSLLQYSTGIISSFSDAVSVGINLDDSGNVVNRSYYKDKNGSSIRISYTEF